MEDNNTNNNEKKYVEGAMKFQIDIMPGDIGIALEDSNENRLAAAHLISLMYDELWNRQMEAGQPEHKMSKAELKELQIARKFLGKHISVLGSFVHGKYKDAVFTKDKPKIDIITTADILNNPNLKVIN
jgi:hypothetical protein